MNLPLLEPEIQQSIRRITQNSTLRHQATDQENLHTGRNMVNRDVTSTGPLDLVSSSSPAPRRGRKKHQSRSNEQSLSEGRPDGNDWFGQPMHGRAPSKKSHPRRSKQTLGPDVSIFDSDVPPRSQRVRNQADSFTEHRLSSKNNTDIRDFLGRRRTQQQRSTSLELTPGPPSFTPINRPSRDLRAQNTEAISQHEIPRPTSLSRASSAEPPRRSKRARTQAQSNPQAFEPLDFADQLRAYAKRKAPPHSRHRPSSPDPSIILAPASVSAYPAEPPRPPPRTTHREIPATFASSPSATSHPIRPPRNQSPHESTPPHRRRTTDGTHRSKSSRLPLERVPAGYRIQNVVLPLYTDITSIIKAMQKLDMRRGSLAWGYPSDESAYDAFSTQVTESELRAWVLRVDGMLEGFDTQADRQGVMMTLERGIAKALGEKQGGAQGMQRDGTIKPSHISQIRESAQQPSSVLAAEVPVCNSDVVEQPHAINPAVLVRRDEGVDEFGDEDLDDAEMLMDF